MKIDYNPFAFTDNRVSPPKVETKSFPEAFDVTEALGVLGSRAFALPTVCSLGRGTCDMSTSCGPSCSKCKSWKGFRHEPSAIRKDLA